MEITSPRTPMLRLIDTVLEVFTNESDRIYKLLFAILACLVALFSILKVYGGLSPIWAPWDVFTQLNGGWRIVNGQIPYVDYYNPIGLLAYIPTAVAMRFDHFSASSVVYGNVILGTLFALWAWYIARERLSSVNAFVFACFIFMLSISTRPLGYWITDTTYAMIYNRYGYALFSVLLIQLFIPCRSVSDALRIIDGLSAGVLMALLLYCKITYFLVGLGSLAVYLVIFRPWRAWTAMLGVGFLLIVAGMLVFFQVGLIGYVQALDLAAQSQSIGMRFVQLVASLKNNALWIALTYFLLLLSSGVVFGPHLSKTELWKCLRLWVIVTLVVVSDILLSSGNASERKDAPLFFISGLIIFDFLIRSIQTVAKYPSPYASAAALLVIAVVIPLFFGYIFSKDVASVVYTAVWNKTHLSSLPQSQRFQSNTLSDFVIPDNSDWATAYWRAKDVPNRINDGLNLLRRHVDKNTRIFCFCLTDPFSFGLDLSPAVGTPLWWDDNFSFSAQVHPEPNDLFRNVNVVMLPVFKSYDDGCCKETVYLMEKIYGAYLEKNFSEEDRSTYWILLAKSNGKPSAKLSRQPVGQNVSIPSPYLAKWRIVPSIGYGFDE